MKWHKFQITNNKQFPNHKTQIRNNLRILTKQINSTFSGKQYSAEVKLQYLSPGLSSDRKLKRGQDRFESLKLGIWGFFVICYLELSKSADNSWIFCSTIVVFRGQQIPVCRFN